MSPSIPRARVPFNAKAQEGAWVTEHVDLGLVVPVSAARGPAGCALGGNGNPCTGDLLGKEGKGMKYRYS